MTTFAQIVVGAVAEGALYALIALALAVVLYPMRVFHVALGGIFVGSAYTVGLTTNQLGFHWILGSATALVISVGLGLAIELWVYRPLAGRRASTLAVAISSFAVYFVLVNAFASAVGNQHMVVPYNPSILSLAGIVLSDTQIAMMVSGAVALCLLIVGLRTPLGQAVRAIEDNADLLRACGWSVARVRLACIGISSILGGLAGILTSLDKGIEPGMGMPVLLNGLVVVVASGPGAYRGLFAVAVGLALLQSGVAFMISPRWSVAVSFAVLTAFLIFRPNGLFSVSKRVEELA